jgi:hypothetical protein
MYTPPNWNNYPSIKNRAATIEVPCRPRAAILPGKSEKGGSKMFKPYNVLVYERENDKTSRFIMEFATLREMQEWIENAKEINPEWTFF